MLPNEIILLENIPTTLSGKVDLSALPLPGAKIIEVKHPKTATEAALLACWLQCLLLEQISTDADFFALGGNSLQAMQICAQLEEKFYVTLNIHFFYEYPTIEQQSQFIEASIYSLTKENLQHEL